MYGPEVQLSFALWYWANKILTFSGIRYTIIISQVWTLNGSHVKSALRLVVFNFILGLHTL